ncbi:hypothetical protein JCM4814A_81070 [Streptomyces phaeofaciens JCM 4814]|uniref:Uncharacterized protein n=1 Tax=Streptomyces phaeofaciens TaxID=68254 RepID=A0A918HR26_9ACTN|nr:hypothetical protein GCM10010226_90610 [Streptomyces phaeofaciens]
MSVSGSLGQADRLERDHSARRGGQGASRTHGAVALPVLVDTAGLPNTLCCYKRLVRLTVWETVSGAFPAPILLAVVASRMRATPEAGADGAESVTHTNDPATAKAAASTG